MPKYIAIATTPPSESSLLYDRVIKGQEYEIRKCGVPDHVEIVSGTLINKDMDKAQHFGSFIPRSRVDGFVNLVS